MPLDLDVRFLFGVIGAIIVVCTTMVAGLKVHHWCEKNAPMLGLTAPFGVAAGLAVGLVEILLWFR